MKAKKMMLLIGIILFIIGLICIVIKGMLGDYIDSNGFLHEYFFLLPIGFLFIISGLILIIAKLFICKK